MGGGDKALRLLAGRPMIGHVIARMAPQVDCLAINANGDPARFAPFGLPVVADGMVGFVGPLAGVLAGLDWAADMGAGHVLTVPADCPFLPPDLGARLKGAGPFAVAASADASGSERIHPVCGRWPVTLRAPLRAALNAGHRRIGDWALAQGAAVARFDAGAVDPFFNVNSPQDLAQAEMVAACQ